MTWEGRASRLLVLAAALSSAGAVTACFYDSRWGETKAAQKRLAAQTTPGAIQATASDDRPRGAARAYRIRLHPNAHYLTQTIDPERQMANLVEDADRVLVATLGLHLDADPPAAWSFDQDESLEAALAALRRDDTGQDVDVVVGLIGALPRPVDIHQAGYAEVLGNHLVVRAASRLGEQDAFEQALSELKAEERDRVVRARKRHRAVAVLLHEIGHVLGALHEQQPTSLMHASYDAKMSEYGVDSLALMRIALDGKDRAAVARAQLDYIRGVKTDPWAPGERDAARVRLEAASGPTSRPSAVAVVAPAPSASPVDATPELAESDRQRFVQATASFGAGSVAAAYATAKPLFAAYPKSIAVQSLRCQLATVRWLGRQELIRECASYESLADAGAGAVR